MLTSSLGKESLWAELSNGSDDGKKQMLNKSLPSRINRTCWLVECMW